MDIKYTNYGVKLGFRIVACQYNNIRWRDIWLRWIISTKHTLPQSLESYEYEYGQ